MTPLISQDCCEVCDHAATELETGAGYCKASPSGDCECEAYRLVLHLEEIAAQVAALYRHIGAVELRRELAEGTADGFASALYEQGAGATFDSGAFLEACGMREQVTA